MNGNSSQLLDVIAVGDTRAPQHLDTWSAARLSVSLTVDPRRHYVKDRVFFADEEAAVASGYRPCGACLLPKYRQWHADPESRAVGGRADPEPRSDA